MAQVSIFEWEGSYAISGSITPALAAEDSGVVTIRATGVDERITFQAAQGDSVSDTGGGTADIVVNVQGGSNSFLVPLDVDNSDTEEGDLSINLEIVSFVVNGGAIRTDISVNSDLEVTIVDDEVAATLTIGSFATSADETEALLIPIGLDRAAAEDVSVSISVLTANGLDAADITVPTTVTFTGNNNLAAGADSEVSSFVPFIVNNATAAGTALLTIQVSNGNAAGLHTASVTVEGAGPEVVAELVSTAAIVRSEQQEGPLGMTAGFSQPLPAAGTLEFSVSPTPDARLVNSNLAAPLESTFQVTAPAGATSIILPVETIDVDGEQGDIQYTFTLTSFTSNSSSYTTALGTRLSRLVTILDDEVPAQVTISSPEDGNTILEGEDATIVASLDRPVSEELIIILSPDGDAVLDTDYALDNRITIPAYATEGSDTGLVQVLDTAFPNLNVTLSPSLAAGTLGIIDSDNTVSFTTSGDGNPVEIQFSGAPGAAVEGGDFDLTFSASTELVEDVEAVVTFPATRFPSMADENFEQSIIIPAGVSSFTFTGAIPQTATTTTTSDETFTLTSVAPASTPNLSTPSLGANTQHVITVTDNDIDAVIGFSVGSMNLAGGDTGNTLELLADRTVSQDVVLNISVVGGTLPAGDILNAPAQVLMRAGASQAEFDFDVDAASTGGECTIVASIASGPAVMGAATTVTVTVDSTVVVDSVLALAELNVVRDVNEWEGGTFTLSGTVTPAFPVSGNVVITNTTGDSRLTFLHGSETSTVTVPVAGGTTDFTFDVHVSSNDVADAAVAQKINRISITGGESTDHAVTLDQGDTFFRITDDDLPVGMNWSVDKTSVFIDDTNGADIEVTVNIDAAVSADASFSFDYSWRETFVGGGLTIPVITIPAHATTATGTIQVAAGTYQDFNLVLSSGTGLGNDLVVEDAADQAAVIIDCPDAPVPPGVALGAPSQLVHRLPSQEYLATQFETAAYDSFINGSPDFLLQAVVPVDPVDATALPFFTIDGNHADVFPVAYDHEDKVTSVQVVAPADTSYTFESVDLALTSNSIAGSGILEMVETPGTATQTLVDINLDELTLSLMLDDGSQIVPVNTPAFSDWTLVDTERDGDYITEKHYFTQFQVYPEGYTQPTGYSHKVMGVHAWVTQRSDVNAATIDFALTNDIFDETIADRSADHPEVNGDVWFYGIKINSPAGYAAHEGSQYEVINGNVRLRETDHSIDNLNQWLVRPVNESAPAQFQVTPIRGTHSLHVLPRRNKIQRKVAIARNTNEGKALALWLNRFGGYSIAYPMAFDAGVPLGNNYQAKRGFAAQQDYLPEIDTEYADERYHPQDDAWYSQFGSGREQFRARAAGTLSIIRAGARGKGGHGWTDGTIMNGSGWELWRDGRRIWGTNDNDPKIYSWYRPYMHSWLRDYGGKGIVPRAGYHQQPEEIEMGWLQQQYFGQRNRKTFTNLEGKIITPEMMAAPYASQNGGVPILPWAEDFWFDQNGGGQHPWFFGPLVNGNMQPTTPGGLYKAEDVNPPLAPTNRFWNNPPAGIDTIYSPVEDLGQPGADGATTLKQMFADGRGTDAAVYDYHSLDGEHHFRGLFFYQPQIWFGNIGIAKWAAQQESEHVRMCMSQYDVMGGYTHTDGYTYKVQGSDRHTRCNLKHIADNANYQIATKDGKFLTVRNHGEGFEGIAMGFATVGNAERRAQVKSEWLPVMTEALRVGLGPYGASVAADGIMGESGNLGTMAWDSTWQELCYLESGLSGAQDIFDLDDTNFLLEVDRRKGAGTLPDGTVLRMTQYITGSLYFNHGIFGCLVSMEGCDPENLGSLGQILLDPLAYVPLRQWQWLDRKRVLLDANTSAFTYDDEDLFRLQTGTPRHHFLPTTGFVTGSQQGNFTYPAMDFVPWSWDTATNQTSHHKLVGKRPSRDTLQIGIAYRMSGDQRFLKWGRQMLWDNWRDCTWDASWNSNGPGNANPFTCNEINPSTKDDLVPVSFENTITAYAHGVAQERQSVYSNATIEPPTLNDTLGTHMAPAIGEMRHLDWNLTYDPKKPHRYDEIANSPTGQAYFQNATGNGGGVGFPEGTKKATDVIADFVFSGTTIADTVSSLTMETVGQGSLTAQEAGGVSFVTFSNGRMDIPVADSDAIRNAITGDAVTFEFWVRSHDITNDGPARILSWSDAPTYIDARNISISQSKYGNAPEYHGALGIQTGGSLKLAAPGSPHFLQEDKLTHVVVSVEGTAASGWVNVYNDAAGTDINKGIQVTDSPLVRTGLGRRPNAWVTGNAISVGDEKDGNVDSRHFDGDIFRVSVYDGVFTPEDVSGNFYAGPAADLGVVTVTTPARASFTSTQMVENEDVDQKIITVTGSYNKPLETPTVLTIRSNIPGAETRLDDILFDDLTNELDIALDAGESTFSFELLMTSAEGDQGTQVSRFFLESDSGADSEIDGAASALTLQLVDGHVPDNTGGTGGGGSGGSTGGGTGGSTGGTGSFVSEITTDQGVTWYFDRQVEAGQFVTGDWWVIGPVNVVDIFPRPEYNPDNGVYLNGSMINPMTPSSVGEYTGYQRTDSDDRDFSMQVSAMTFDSPGRRYTSQGYVSYEMQYTGNRVAYDHSLNAAYPDGINPVGPNNPIVLQPGETLQSAWTQPAAPYVPGSTDLVKVYEDDILIRSDYELGKAPWAQKSKLIGGNDSGHRGVNRCIEPLTCLSAVPAGYNSGGSNTGGGTGGGGIPTNYREAMLPTRIGTWYTAKTKVAHDPAGNPYTLNIWEDLNAAGVGMTLRWQNHKNIDPIDPPYSEGEYQGMIDTGMEFIGVRSLGIESDDPALPTSFNKPHNPTAPDGYKQVGFSVDDWDVPFTAIDPDGNSITADYWMLGHEMEMSQGSGYRTVYDLDAGGNRKWTEYDSTRSYSAGDKVYMIDRQSAWTSNTSYNTNYGRTQIFEAVQDVPAGTAPSFVLQAGTSDQYVPTDTAFWTRDGSDSIAWGKNVPVYALKAAAEKFKQAYPGKKLYYFFTKGVCIAGWNGLGSHTRAGIVDPVAGTLTDQLSYFEAVAGIEEFDGFMFDYYPFNSKPTGRLGSNNPDPPATYTNPVTGLNWVVDDPKWVVSGVTRIKNWSVSPDFPEGKPVYVTLPSTPNFVSGVDTTNANPTADGLLAYYHNDRPTVDEMKSLVTSCVDEGADGFIWYNHTWGCNVKNWATAPFTTDDIEILAAGPLSDFWPYAYKQFWNTKPANGGVQVTDPDGNPTNLHGKYFPDIPNVDVSGDGSWEMLVEVNQHILDLLPELEDVEVGGAIVPPLGESQPPAANSSGWFRPSVHAMTQVPGQKEVQYHTSSVDAFLDSGQLANLPLDLIPNFPVFDHATFMTPSPMGYSADGLTEVANPDSYYYELPDGTKVTYWNPGSKSRVSANNKAATDYFFSIGQHFGPARQGTNYGGSGGIVAQSDACMLVLNSDIPREHKRDLLIWWMQYAIDLDALYRNGLNWMPNGAHNSGRYSPILMKRLVFGEDLSDLYPLDFADNRQIFYMSSVDLNHYVCLTENPAATNADPGECRTFQVGCEEPSTAAGVAAAANGSDNVQGRIFYPEMVGCPIWTQWGWPAYRGDNTKSLTSDWVNPKYLDMTAKQRHGQAIGWRAMNKMAEYGHDAYFDYVDRSVLLGNDKPYNSVQGSKRMLDGLPMTGGDSQGFSRTKGAVMYDIWRRLVGFDFDLSTTNFNNVSGWDVNANTYRNSAAVPAVTYHSLSAALGGSWQEPNNPGGPGTGPGGSGPTNPDGAGRGGDPGDPGNNPFYPGVGEDGTGDLYPPAIDDSATNTDGVINGANTGHRTTLASMTVSAIPTTGDNSYTFANTGDCGGHSHCIEVPPAGLTVSAVVFSAVDSYQHNQLIQIDNNLTNPLTFEDCLFIGQTHFFQRYSDNGGTVKTAELGKSTKNNGNAYLFDLAAPSDPNTISNLHFRWCSMRGSSSKMTNVPFQTMYRMNFDWYAADAVNLKSANLIHFEECWWGDSSHVRGMTTCNPTDSPHLFDCTQQSTYGGFDVENCKPLHYTQCGHFAYDWTWVSGAEVHSDSYQNTSADIEELRFTRCTFANQHSQWIPKNSGAWYGRWPLNSAARYGPHYHDNPEKLAKMTVDGYPSPPTSTSATIITQAQDKHFQLDGYTARHQRIIYDRCNYNGTQASYHSFKNGKFKLLKGSDGVKRWVIEGCPDPTSPLYPGGGNDPDGSPGYEQYDSNYYIPGACYPTNTGYNPLYGTRYQEPTKWEFSSCTFAISNRSQMWQLHSSQNLGIPHDVLVDLEPTPINSSTSLGPLSSCDQLRAVGYTEANGWASMATCIDNFDAKEIISDGNNKFIDNETGETCANIRLNDDTNVYGTINPAVNIEDFIEGNAIVGNNKSVINRLNGEKPEHWNDYSVYDGTFYHPYRQSSETGTNDMPYYLFKAFTSRDRCTCED